METLKRLTSAILAVGAALAFGIVPASAEKFTFKIASGHPTSWHFIQYTKDYFVPEVKKRAKEKGHDVEFVEGWAGAMVKATEVLAAAGELPVNVRFACDGEEEIGGHSIVDWLAEDTGTVTAASQNTQCVVLAPAVM